MTYPSSFIRFCSMIGISQTDLEKCFDPIKLNHLKILFEDPRQQHEVIDSVIAIKNHAQRLGDFLTIDTIPTYGFWP